jgi:hypothetical protein
MHLCMSCRWRALENWPQGIKGHPEASLTINPSPDTADNAVGRSPCSNCADDTHCHIAWHRHWLPDCQAFVPCHRFVCPDQLEPLWNPKELMVAVCICVLPIKQGTMFT